MSGARRGRGGSVTGGRRRHFLGNSRSTHSPVDVTVCFFRFDLFLEIAIFAVLVVIHLQSTDQTP